MYGTQAETGVLETVWLFENDVKMYGTQALDCSSNDGSKFENDVKMYGTQAGICRTWGRLCLRMM